MTEAGGLTATEEEPKDTTSSTSTNIGKRTNDLDQTSETPIPKPAPKPQSINTVHKRTNGKAAGNAAAKAAATQARNQSYVQKMLSLPKLVFTEQMLRFMLQDGVAQILVSFITQVPQNEEDVEDRPRPLRGGPLTESLKKSYRAAMLLAGPEPTEALGVFVESRAPLLFTSLFGVFAENSRGSYAHACHVLDCLIEYDVDMCLEALSSSLSDVVKLVGAMLTAIEQPPVAATLIKLLRCDEASTRQKWDFYARLNQYQLLRRIACCLSGSVKGFEDLEHEEGGRVPWYIDAPPARREACTELLSSSWEFMIEEDVFAAELLLKPSIEDVVKALATAATAPNYTDKDQINGHQEMNEGAVPRSAAIHTLNELVARAGAAEVEGDLPLDGELDEQLEEDDPDDDKTLLLPLYAKISLLLEAGELEAWVVRMDRRRREVAVVVHRVLARYIHVFSDALIVEERTVCVEVDVDVHAPLGIGLTNSATIGHLKAKTQFNVRAPAKFDDSMAEESVQFVSLSKDAVANLDSEDETSTNKANERRLSPKEEDVEEEEDVSQGVDDIASNTAASRGSSYKRLALHAVVPGSRIVSVKPKLKSNGDDEVTEGGVTRVESLTELSGALQKCRDAGAERAVLELEVPTAGISPAQALYSEEATLSSSGQFSLLDKVGIVCLLADMITVHPDHLDIIAASPLVPIQAKPDKEDPGSAIDLCPWYRLNTVFFAHPKSDMLSNAYFQLFEAAVRNNHTASLRYLFIGDACFFGRLVAPLTRHPDEFTHPIDAPHVMLNNTNEPIEDRTNEELEQLETDETKQNNLKSVLSPAPILAPKELSSSVEIERERHSSEDSILSSTSNISSFSSYSNSSVICLPTAAPALPIAQALRFCQVLRECWEEHPDNSILSSTLRKHALWSSEVLPRLGVLEGAWNDHGMGIPVGSEEGVESEGDSDEEEVLESIGDEEYELNNARARDEEAGVKDEDDDDDNIEGIEPSSMIHLIELSRTPVRPSLQLLNGKFEVVGTDNPEPPCLSFSSPPRRWRDTKKIRQTQPKTLVEDNKNSQMTSEEARWCAEQRAKDETMVQQNRTNGLSDLGEKTTPQKETPVPQTFLTPEQYNREEEAHAEAEAIFFAPFLGSPEIKHSICPPRNNRSQHNRRRASEIRPDYSPETERINPLLRGVDGKVTGRMSPIKAPKRSPTRSSTSPRG